MHLDLRSTNAGCTCHGARLPTRPSRGPAVDTDQVTAQADKTLWLAAQAPSPYAAVADLAPQGGTDSPSTGNSSYCSRT